MSKNIEVIPEREREVSEKEVYAGIPGTGGEAGLSTGEARCTTRGPLSIKEGPMSSNTSRPATTENAAIRPSMSSHPGILRIAWPLNPALIAKQKASGQWCANASDHAAGYDRKPWRYVLIPYDEIAENMTLEGLAVRFRA